MSKLFILFAHIVLFLVSVAALILMIYELGFNLNITEHTHIRSYYRDILIVFLISYSIRIFFRFKDIRKEKGLWFEAFAYILLLLAVFVHARHPFTWPDDSLFIRIFNSKIIMYALLLFFSLLELSKRIFNILSYHISPGLLFAYSFILIILLGTGMLMLPRATVSPITLTDAFFTSTSAVCVTGLTVFDVSAVLTPLGKGILIGLIQVGGIGIMTFTSFFALTFMGHSSFQNNLILKDLLNQENLNGIFRTLINIIITTFVIELLGACFILYSIHGTMGISMGNEMLFAIFHSISGFCNAGFSVLSGNLHDPMVSTNYLLHTIVAIMIIFGGIGFPILFNFYKLIGHFFHNKWFQIIGRQKRYIHTKIIHLNTRISLITTMILFVVGFILFFVLEFDHTLRELSWHGKIATAFFGSVTPRTAGFNTVELTALMPATIFVTIILMWIGASPMSTGGGIKTTTFAIACMNIINVARGKDKMELGRREVLRTTRQRAFAVIMLSVIWLFISVLCVSIAEPHVELTRIFFECVSALGTVGLTLNLTPDLSAFSKWILIITMFFGRVGALTILSGVIPKYIDNNYSYPKESIMVG